MIRWCLSTLCVATVSLPTFVFADSWDDFVQYCLDPISVGELAQPHDLVANGNYKNDGDMYSNYRVNGDRATLDVSYGHMGQPFWCRLSADDTSADAELANRFLAWSSQQAVLDSFHEVNVNSSILTLQGSKTNGPALQLSMDMTATNTGIVFIAKELN